MKKSNRNKGAAVTYTRSVAVAFICLFLGQITTSLGMTFVEVKMWFFVPARIFYAVALCGFGAMLVREVKKLSAEKQQKEKECSPTSNEGAAENAVAVGEPLLNKET